MPQHKAVLSLNIKSVDENRRVLRGIANSGQRDRVGEIVDVMSARFAASVPLLIAHKHDQVVGTVRFGAPTREGLPFEATMPKVEDPGPLKDRVDTAWLEVRHRLINKVSIGFGHGKFAGGIWSDAEIFELSLVAVPADSRADILEVSGAKGLRGRSATTPRLLPICKPKRGQVLLDGLEKRVNAYARTIYEKSGRKMPHFANNDARDRWRMGKHREAHARGAKWLDPFEVAEGVRLSGKLPGSTAHRVVKLRG